MALFSTVDLAIHVLRESDRPLTLDEIVDRVQAICPIDAKNPRKTIQSALYSTTLVARVAQGTFWWKPKVYAGSRIRLAVPDSALEAGEITYSEEVREALWPSWGDAHKRADWSPVDVILEGAGSAQFELCFLRPAEWGMRVDSRLRQWLDATRARFGGAEGVRRESSRAEHSGASDSLAENARARRSRVKISRAEHSIVIEVASPGGPHRVSYSSRSQDASRRAARNAEMVVRCNAIATRLTSTESPSTSLSKCVENLLIEGFYRDPVPPDPVEAAWRADHWPPGVWVYGHPGKIEMERLRQVTVPLIQAGHVAAVPPFSLDEFFERAAGLSLLPSPPRGAGSERVALLLRATPEDDIEVHRDIRLADDHSLHDLHLMIQRAFAWANDRHYSFFMSGQVWDDDTEFGSPSLALSDPRGGPRPASRAYLYQFDLRVGEGFVYLFDYDDDRLFHVEVLDVDPRPADLPKFPRIVSRIGRSPSQNLGR